MRAHELNLKRGDCVVLSKERMDEVGLVESKLYPVGVVGKVESISDRTIRIKWPSFSKTYGIGVFSCLERPNVPDYKWVLNQPIKLGKITLFEEGTAAFKANKYDSSSPIVIDDGVHTITFASNRFPASYFKKIKIN